MSDAKQRYKVDKKAIMLNTGVSTFSTATVGGILSAFNTVPISQLPMLLAAVFAAQVLPKILIEYNNRYQKVKAQRDAFREGRNYSTKDMASNWSQNLFYLFFSGLDKATYF